MRERGARETRTPSAQPWKTNPNLRAFTVKQQERRQAAQALAERNSQSGFNVNPDYSTVHTDAFGPSTSGVIKKERCVRRTSLIPSIQRHVHAALRRLCGVGGAGDGQVTQAWGRVVLVGSPHPSALPPRGGMAERAGRGPLIGLTGRRS